MDNDTLSKLIGGEIVENLKECYDPEISVNIYDLGLIYDINLDNLPKVTITHTLTRIRTIPETRI